MTAPVRFLRPVALWMAFLFCLGALPVRGTLADSFTIRCDWFDRGNVDAGSVARNYAGKYPCIVNGGVMPNTAEYDLEFPVAGEYTVHALYAAETSRPVEISLDGKPLVRGFTDVTGNWHTDHAQWFRQCTVQIAAGKHTVKLLCESCIPHICALRFESSAAFPKDWQVNRCAAQQKKAAAQSAPSRRLRGLLPAGAARLVRLRAAVRPHPAADTARSPDSGIHVDGRREIPRGRRNRPRRGRRQRSQRGRSDAQRTAPSRLARWRRSDRLGGQPQRAGQPRARRNAKRWPCRRRDCGRCSRTSPS